jgi:hypothetical protein
MLFQICRHVIEQFRVFFIWRRHQPMRGFSLRLQWALCERYDMLVRSIRYEKDSRRFWLDWNPAMQIWRFVIHGVVILYLTFRSWDIISSVWEIELLSEFTESLTAQFSPTEKNKSTTKSTTTVPKKRKYWILLSIYPVTLLMLCYILLCGHE